MGKYEQPKKKKPSTAGKKAAAQGSSGKKIAIIIGAVALAIIIGVFGYAAAVAKSGNIFPGVTVAGVNVGGMSKEEATAAVQEAVDSTYGSTALEVKLPDRTLSFTPESTNVTLDVAGAVEEAWSYGRNKGIFQALSFRFGGGKGGAGQYVNIADSLTLDENYIHTALGEVAVDVKSDKMDSSYEISYVDDANGEKIPGELTLSVGTSQRTLDTDALFDLILAAYMTNDFTPVEFSYTEELYAPVELDSLYDTLCTNMKDAYYDSEKKEIIPEIVGYGFDLAAAKQQQAMASEGDTLVFQLEVLEPEVTLAELEEKLFHDVLGAYDSPHVYNPSRTNNLDLACKAIDGTILNPGDIFSFNDIVGIRSAEKGYAAATVYVSGESKPELGGGVCQVASTIYVCALLADLNVVERTEHMFTVSYVPMGADATIYWGSLDFRFENSTAYPMRVDATVSDGYVHIALIGTSSTDETIKLIPVTNSTTAWTEREVVDETKPANYREVTQTPYTGYKVTLYIQRCDAVGNAIGDKELAQYPNSTYRMRERIVTIGKPEEEKPPEPPVTDPTTDPVDPPVDPVDPPVDPTPTEPDPTPTEPDGNGSAVLD